MIRLVKECGKGRENMSKVEDFIAATKLNELVNKKEEDKHGKTVLWALAIVGTVAAIAAIAYAVYFHRHKMVLPYLERLRRCPVLAPTVNHGFESPAEECVARSLQRRLQRQGRAVGVAAYAQSSADISV